jgi:putative DNA primase/helicase
MATAEDIAAQYDLTPIGDSYTGECPSCGYRGFTVTDKDERTLFYCHGGGCTQEEIISVLRDVGLWGQSVTALFDALDLVPAAAARPEHGGDSKKIEYALEMWRRSQPAQGTAVEAYLRSRGYQGPIPPDLRMVMGRHHSDRATYPIMIGAATRTADPDQITGIHRTFLRLEGCGKADLPDAKMSLGRVRGAAVRLAPVAAKLAVSEGIETGLSFMQATDIPTWAALSTSGLKALILPQQVREIVIAADPDEQGLKAAREAAMRWWAEGRKVRIAKPPTGLDFNDLARTS